MLYILLRIDVIVAIVFVSLYFFMMHEMSKVFKKKYPEKELQKVKFKNWFLLLIRTLAIGLIPIFNVIILLGTIVMAGTKTSDELFEEFKVNEIVKESDNKSI